MNGPDISSKFLTSMIRSFLKGQFWLLLAIHMDKQFSTEKIYSLVEQVFRGVSISPMSNYARI